MDILTYPTASLPPIWKWQVLSFLRVMWPDGFAGENQWRDWITNADDLQEWCLTCVNKMNTALALVGCS
jgi:hypothetical protein